MIHHTSLTLRLKRYAVLFIVGVVAAFAAIRLIPHSSPSQGAHSEVPLALLESSLTQFLGHRPLSKAEWHLEDLGIQPIYETSIRREGTFELDSRGQVVTATFELMPPSTSAPAVTSQDAVQVARHFFSAHSIVTSSFYLEGESTVPGGAGFNLVWGKHIGQVITPSQITLSIDRIGRVFIYRFFDRPITIDTTPHVSSATAAAAAMSKFGGSMVIGSPELYLTESSGGKEELLWSINLEIGSGFLPTAQVVTVDALSGQVVTPSK